MDLKANTVEQLKDLIDWMRQIAALETPGALVWAEIMVAELVGIAGLSEDADATVEATSAPFLAQYGIKHVPASNGETSR